MSRSSFNPKARWDRNIPEDNAYHPELLNERIDCLALFKSGKIYPQKFIWLDKDYEVRSVTYNWQERLGIATINYFSVNTNSGLYQISFNNETFRWQVDKIIE